MQVNIGEKIKELRKRDGRKQEDLARALGVTAQAVSRWESGGCYPDMGLLPAIANYFHVSIDALFGYHNDREEKIRTYMDKANQAFINGLKKPEEAEPIIEMLREGLEEFPEEPGILRFLALALTVRGRKGIEKNNAYLTEAAEIYEKLAAEDNQMLMPLLELYASMGEYEKAEKRAREQTEVQNSREVLLANIYENTRIPTADKQERRYRGEAILVLLHEMYRLLEKAVVRDVELNCSGKGVEILTALQRVYQVVFDGDDYYDYHSDLCMINLDCARISSRVADIDAALAFFDAAFDHYTEHIRNMFFVINKKKVETDYKSPLLREVGDDYNTSIVICRKEFFEGVLEVFSDEIRKRIENNPKYRQLFED